MQPGLTLVSNRLPVSVRKVNGELEFYPSIGGLATGLSSYATDKHSRWIGWPGIPSEELSASDKKYITAELAKQNCCPVFLSKRQIDDFYNGYSNSILWLLFHDVAVAEATRQKEARYFGAYKKVNALFAEAVLKFSEPGSLIWVHDYQLLLLPQLLRAARPAAKIGFFLHIPFPGPSTFKSLTEAKNLVAGMLGADLIGFHTKTYVHNFLDTAADLDAGIVTQKDIAVHGRVVRIANFPMGIDYAKYTGAIKSLAVQRELIKLRARYSGSKLILTVDRLDPTKGLVERATAYREFLRQNPRLHGKVTLAMVAVPSRTEINEYKELKSRLEKLIQETNEEFANPWWAPIDYIYRSLSFEQLSAFYRRADIAFITPLRDGMNLVAKEYVASQYHRRGVLVLSQTAGAAQELSDAVIVDPSDQDSLVRGLSQAVSMSKLSWLGRFLKMQRQLRAATVNVWAGNFLKSLLVPLPDLPTRTYALTAGRQKEIVQALRASGRRLFLLDYDGALVPIVDRPDEILPSEELKALLGKLAGLPRTDVVVISGRSQAELTKWFGQLPIGLVAEHGAFYRLAGGKRWSHIIEAKYAWKKELIPILEIYASKTPGAFVEIKDATLVWHYRMASPYQAQKNLVVLRRQIAPLAEQYGLRIYEGKKIMEVQPAGIDKGSAAQRWLAKAPDFVLAIGDDYTDEDTFLAVPREAYTIRIGPGHTTARLRAPNVKAILKLLGELGKAS